MPRLKEFKTLCQVIEQKSFSRAAELLGLTQPAVSLQIKSLEAEYGAELLHREGFEILPTENGEVVYNFACQIIDLYLRSQEAVQASLVETRGHLSIGASTGPGEYLLPLLLGRFKGANPDVTVSLRVGDSNEIIEHVLQQRLEVGFVGATRRDRHLTFEPFLHDELILVVYPEHPWAQRKHITYEELLQAPLVLQQQGSGARATLQEALHRYGITLQQLHPVMEVGLQESTKAAVRSGFGVTIISRLGATDELHRGILIEVPIEDVNMAHDFHVVYLRTLPLPNLARTFLDFARTTAQEISAGRK